MPTTDDFGTWIDLGTTILDSLDWVNVSTPLGSTSQNVFRVTHISPSIRDINGFCWIRTHYSLGGVNLVTKAIKLFPNTDTQAIRLEQYYELDNFSFITRTLQLQRFDRYKKLGASPLVSWAIRIEELQ